MRHGRPSLRFLTVVPDLYHGYPLYRDDPADPDVYRIDLDEAGTSRVVFGRDAAGVIDALAFEMMPIRLERRPARTNPRRWLFGLAALFALVVATLNAVLRHLGLARGTVHCRDDDPEDCGREIARTLAERYGSPRVGLIGLNPAIAEHLVNALGPDRVRITDLDPDRIGRRSAAERRALKPPPRGPPRGCPRAAPPGLPR